MVGGHVRVVGNADLALPLADLALPLKEFDFSAQEAAHTRNEFQMW